MIDPAIHVVLRGGLALLMGLAAWHKLGEPRHFRAVVADYRLLPALLVPVFAVGVGLGEAALAVTLLALPASALPALGAAALLTVYGCAIAINLVRGRRLIDCGCTGPASRQPLSGALVVRNTILVAAALAAAAPTTQRTLSWIDAMTVAAATAYLALLWATASTLLANAPRLAELRRPR